MTFSYKQSSDVGVLLESSTYYVIAVQTVRTVSQKFMTLYVDHRAWILLCVALRDSCIGQSTLTQMPTSDLKYFFSHSRTMQIF